MKMATMAKRIQVLESFGKNELHDLLIANRFLDDESIWHVLSYADEEAWDHVYSNRKTYAHRIQTLIEPYDFLPDRSKIKMRHTDLTDEVMANLEKERRGEKMKQFEPIWESIKTSIPDRPVSDLDNDLDDAWQALSAARDAITAYTESRRGAYISPSARTRGDAEKDKLDTEFNKCKKEFDNLEKLIEDADNEYLMKKKNERFEEWLREL